MKTLIEEYVENLSDQEIIEILESWEEFSAKGAIGDKPIRSHAKKVTHGITDTDITRWMQMLAFECALVFARRYIKTLNS